MKSLRSYQGRFTAWRMLVKLGYEPVAKTPYLSMYLDEMHQYLTDLGQLTAYKTTGFIL